MDFFDEPGENKEDEGNEPEVEEDDMKEVNDAKDFADKELEKRVKKTEATTIEGVKKDLGYNPAIPAGQKKPLGPGRAAALELLKKFNEEKEKGGK